MKREGITFLKEMPEVKHNYSYFPIFINEMGYGMCRDALYEKLKNNNIFGRRYFYPLISQFPPYRGLDSAQPGMMPVAERVTQEVICLPIYADLEEEAVEKICTIICS